MQTPNFIKEILLHGPPYLLNDISDYDKQRISIDKKELLLSIFNILEFLKIKRFNIFFWNCLIMSNILT